MVEIIYDTFWSMCIRVVPNPEIPPVMGMRVESRVTVEWIVEPVLDAKNIAQLIALEIYGCQRIFLFIITSCRCRRKVDITFIGVSKPCAVKLPQMVFSIPVMKRDANFYRSSSFHYCNLPSSFFFA